MYLRRSISIASSNLHMHRMGYLFHQKYADPPRGECLFIHACRDILILVLHHQYWYHYVMACSSF